MKNIYVLLGSKVMEDVWYVSGVFETYGKSYKCEETKKVNLSNGLEMDVNQLQYRAFGTTKNDTFSNTGKCTVNLNLHLTQMMELFKHRKFAFDTTRGNFSNIGYDTFTYAGIF